MVELAVGSNNPVMRTGLRAILESADAYICLETTADGLDVQTMGASGCAGVFLDLSNERASLEVCQALSSQEDAPPITGVDWLQREPSRLQRLWAAGMKGYVSVSRDVAPLVQAVEASERGETIVYMESGPDEDGPRGLESGVRAPVLDDTDREILEELKEGLKDREIAEKLAYNDSTVRHRIENLEHRYECRTRFQLACRLIGTGQLQPGPWQPAHQPARGQRRRK